jgi:multiple sugar transport system ATP-binding protein
MAEIGFHHVTKRFPDGTVAVNDAELSIADREFVVFVGPSGCGKTTLLRMVAGLERITSGEITIGGRVVNDVEPSKRDVAMVFQNYALYPHMSARKNIGFPLKMQHMRTSEVASRVAEVAGLLGIDQLLDRHPHELSGGQRQRVAMGRAIVRHPLAFLMDEPLSNLDAMLRIQLRAELVKLHRRLAITTIFVTHDQNEAMTLGERVVVMKRGVIQQADAPKQLYYRPKNTFVASFIGSPPMNFIRGALDRGMLVFGDNRVVLDADMQRDLGRRSGEVLIGLRPEEFREARDGKRASTALAADIEIVEEVGPDMIAYFRPEGLEVVEVGDRPLELVGSLSARLDSRSGATSGERRILEFSLDGIQLFDSHSGDSLLSSSLPSRASRDSPVGVHSRQVVGDA